MDQYMVVKQNSSRKTEGTGGGAVGTSKMRRIRNKTIGQRMDV